jgi:hypothetical protein
MLEFVGERAKTDRGKLALSLAGKKVEIVRLNDKEFLIRRFINPITQWLQVRDGFDFLTRLPLPFVIGSKVYKVGNKRINKDIEALAEARAKAEANAETQIQKERMENE